MTSDIEKTGHAVGKFLKFFCRIMTNVNNIHGAPKFMQVNRKS